MIVDSSVLLLAVDADHPSHGRVVRWWEQQLSGARRVALPWPALTEFIATSTDPSLCERPLSAEAATGLVQDWMDAEPTWVPAPSERHHQVLTSLLTRYSLAGSAVAIAEVAALAMEHGGPVCTTNQMYSRIREIEVLNPQGLAAQRW